MAQIETEAAQDTTTAAGNGTPEAKSDAPATKTLPLLNDQDAAAADFAPPQSGQDPNNAKPGEKQAEPAPTFTPDSYDVSLPEGFAADTELLGEFKTLAAEGKIAPETARKILDLQVKHSHRQLEGFTKQVDAWQAEIKADKDFGGDNLPTTIRDAQAALKTHDPSGTLIKELTAGGYGNHPGVLRFLARVGKSLRTEDNVHTGREQKTDSRPLRDRLWPDELMPS